ncbi:GAP1-N2 domain-containing protein [Mycolicibacterium confluentis]|uniref:Putative ESX-1 scaffolding and assembly protein SaeB n=1 Tax=Mycolicibacterium confluentis TaxID=28047 RepID=A0A7I7Y2Z6_9MYCO|nr:hypothetical protein [Mycolicibacterium confluentis]ORV31194.1 hypothetical protein AWB99_12310 [Mycolicibacterium confluentis]BBZ36007.1 putative ESX-1 scaffolding and assembly protein SaeB [Mycolicibacterium confluentis]
MTASRYGQLTYTSFDAAGSAGGWQVKERSGDISAEEERGLVAGVRTVFHPDPPLPAYPTSEDLEKGPRRLAFGRLDTGAAAYWHSVPAGSDATGRPGNVFAHVVLDRRPDESPRRPIQWWRSGEWLRPYGPGPVAAAQLAPTPPEPGVAVTPDSVIDFLLDPRHWRLGTLFGLLDAVSAAMDGQAPVVLGVDSPDDAAQWTGLLSFLMSAGTASRFSFSTFDRADGLAAAVRAGQHLIAMPRADLAALPPRVVAIDDTATMSLGELGVEPHRTAAGQAIEVTPWSAMAQVALLDSASARGLFDDIDHHAAAAGDEGLHPAWPMAMAVAARPEFADAEEEAASVIAAHSPRGAALDSAVGRTLAAVVADRVGVSTADAWRAVQQGADGAAGEMIDRIYLSRAVTDPAWLDQPSRIPHPPSTFHGRPVPHDLSNALDQGLTQARDAGPERLLRLADLTIRSGIDDDAIRRSLAEEVAPALLDESIGARLVRRLGGRIDARTRLTVAAQLLRTRTTPDGEVAVPIDVVDWLASGVEAPAAAQLTSARAWDGVWLRAAVRGVRSLQAGTDPARQAPGDRRAALWWLRIHDAPQFDALVAAQAWDPSDLLAIGGRGLTGRAVLPTLMGAADSVGLSELSAAVIEAHREDTMVAWAALRVTDLGTWVQQGYVETHQRAYWPLWEAELAALRPGVLHDDATVRLLALSMLALVGHQPFPPSCDRLARLPGCAVAAVSRVCALVDSGVLSAPVLVAVSLTQDDPDRTDEPVVTPSVAALLRQVAAHVAATREFTDSEVDSAAALMAQWTGQDSGGALRRHRKMIGRLVHDVERTAPLAVDTAVTHRSR